MSDMSWLTSVQLPVQIDSQKPVKGTFRFHPTKKVDVVGSFSLKTFVHRHQLIDVGVQIPKVVNSQTFLMQEELEREMVELSLIHI